MAKEYHVIINGKLEVVSKQELETVKEQVEANQLNASFDTDWYLSHGYISSTEFKIRHVDTSDCIDVETAYQEIVDSVMKIYKENNAL